MYREKLVVLHPIHVFRHTVLNIAAQLKIYHQRINRKNQTKMLHHQNIYPTKLTVGLTLAGTDLFAILKFRRSQHDGNQNSLRKNLMEYRGGLRQPSVPARVKIPGTLSNATDKHTIHWLVDGDPLVAVSRCRSNGEVVVSLSADLMVVTKLDEQNCRAGGA